VGTGTVELEGSAIGGMRTQAAALVARTFQSGGCSRPPVIDNLEVTASALAKPRRPRLRKPGAHWLARHFAARAPSRAPCPYDDAVSPSAAHHVHAALSAAREPAAGIPGMRATIGRRHHDRRPQQG